MSKCNVFFCLIIIFMMFPVYSVYASDNFSSQNTENYFIPRGYNPKESMFVKFRGWQVYGGASYVDYFNGTKNETFLAAPSQTDSLIQSNTTGSTGYVFGVDRVIMLGTENNSKFRGIAFGVAMDYEPETFSGVVYQFQSPIFNNYLYTYSAKPLDVMAEVQLYFMGIGSMHLLPYVIAGGGFTTTRLSYNETPAPGPARMTQPFTETTCSASGVIGAGLEFDPNLRLFLRTQYLYHYRGDTSISADTDQSVFSGPIPINLNSQSVDFLLGFRF